MHSTQNSANHSANSASAQSASSSESLFQFFQEGTAAFRAAADQVADAAVYQFRPVVERLTESLGGLASAIADIPFIHVATGIPGLSWLLAALGQVSEEKVQAEVRQLQQQYPAETPDQLAQRVVADFTFKAAGVGLVTNFIPPAAGLLSLVDLGAVSALQAKMIYRIAAIYGFSVSDPTRRGEVLVIWALFTSGSSILKSGLNLVELIPGLGAAIGITSDAALLYGVGYLASRFYRAKQMVPGV